MFCHLTNDALSKIRTAFYVANLNISNASKENFYILQVSRREIVTGTFRVVKMFLFSSIIPGFNKGFFLGKRIEAVWTSMR